MCIRDRYAYRPDTAQLLTSDVQLSTYDFLGLHKHQPILEASAKVIRDFGVGSCGPRGFYGTLENHLTLETDIAEFLGVESAILYSFGSTTVSSVIPAFAKPTDVLIMDDGINYSCQTGAALSKAKVVWFRHNDMNDLEEKLLELECEDGLLSARLTNQALRRRFLVTEGIFTKSGDMAPLLDIVRLKRQHALRLILDDSLAIGVLGENGRGSLEHWGIPTTVCDILVGSLETACAASGGFCCGTDMIVDHQRLSGAGYVFSASLPPFLCTAASQALAVMQSEPERRVRLAEVTARLRSALGGVKGVELTGSKDSPMMFVRWPEATETQINDFARKFAKDHKIAVTMAQFCPLESSPPPPALRICASSGLSDDQLDTTIAALTKALTRTVSAVNSSQPALRQSDDQSSRSESFSERRSRRKGHKRTNSSSLLLDPVEFASDTALEPQRLSDTYSNNFVGSVPFIAVGSWLLQWARSYLEFQVNWGQSTTLMTLKKIRNPALDAIMLCLSVIGSEYATMPIALWISWNVNVAIGRMVVTLYVLNMYIGSFTKNIFCLKRPAGTGNSDFGWPSLHCMTVTSLPFFLLRCFYGSTWVWEQENPQNTFLAFASVFVVVGLVITARLYFGRSSPADVQAGCFMGAGLLRIWFGYAATVDRAVLKSETAWPLLLLALGMLLVHPVPLRRQLSQEAQPFLNDTYLLMVKMLGFGTGYLTGFVGPAVMLASPLPLPASFFAGYCRFCLGLTCLFVVYYIMDAAQLKVTEGLLRFLTRSDEKQLGVSTNFRNGLRVMGTFTVFIAVGGTASWGLPHLFQYLDAALALIPFIRTL
eukprot:TRINITY_DN5887_c0_g2_i1.p1 TRINITY_DN5887_c0_g2~~TRINITY_DN5887_c0_g2_i1.p1  ORF type:complete len:825 (+),score=214.87 TRINITY_DN5887_c0_g2_i1:146-2620(+)